LKNEKLRKLSFTVLAIGKVSSNYKNYPAVFLRKANLVNIRHDLRSHVILGHSAVGTSKTGQTHCLTNDFIKFYRQLFTLVHLATFF